jgi:hypothetical protein
VEKFQNFSEKNTMVLYASLFKATFFKVSSKFEVDELVDRNVGIGKWPRLASKEIQITLRPFCAKVL